MSTFHVYPFLFHDVFSISSMSHGPRFTLSYHWVLVFFYACGSMVISFVMYLVNAWRFILGVNIVSIHLFSFRGIPCILSRLLFISIDHWRQ